MFNLINLVSAHTGNDAYEHGMEFFDWLILILLIAGLIFLVRWIIKRKH